MSVQSTSEFTFFPTRELILQESEKELPFKTIFTGVRVISDLIVSYINKELTGDLVEDLSNLKSFICISNWTENDEHKRISLFLLNNLYRKGFSCDDKYDDAYKLARGMIMNMGIDYRKFFPFATDFRSRNFEEFSSEIKKLNSVYSESIDCLNVRWNPNNKKVVASAISTTVRAIEYVHKDLKDDIEIMDIVLYQDRKLFENYAGPKAVKALIERDGRNISLASWELQRNREIHLLAAKTYGRVLARSFAYRADREIVLTAVKNDGMVLELAPAFYNDKEVVKAAIIQDPDAFYFASNELKRDPDLMAIYLSRKNEIAQANEPNKKRRLEDSN